jgi:hypothetical protein
MSRRVEFFVLCPVSNPDGLELQEVYSTSVKSVVDDVIMGDNQSITKCNSLIDYCCFDIKEQLINEKCFIELMSKCAVYPEEFSSKVFTMTYKAICDFDFTEWLDIADVKQLHFLAYGLKSLKDEIIKCSEELDIHLDHLIIIMLYDA